MKKVLIFGVFDLFHYGHLRVIKRAAKLGDYIIVAIQSDESAKKYKPAGTLYDAEQRAEMIRALRCVDEVIIYDEVVNDIKNIDFDIYARGPDNDHEGIRKAVKWAQDNGKETVILDRTRGISSSGLKGKIEREFK